MNVTPQQLFALVGYPDSGKKIMLSHLFGRSNFFPLKAPIRSICLNNRQFVVINITNHSKRTATYLAYIRNILQWHAGNNTSFMILISLIFDDGPHDIKQLLEYLNSTFLDLHYLVLTSSFNSKQLITDKDLQRLQHQVTRGNIHCFDTLVTDSPVRFKQRADEIRKVINNILRNTGRMT